jgi:hypothetical protein
VRREVWKPGSLQDTFESTTNPLTAVEAIRSQTLTFAALTAQEEAAWIGRCGTAMSATVGVGIMVTHNPLQSGRAEARTGLRMMPTSPPPSRSFRTVGFPQYGWKAGISDGAFPYDRPVKPAPGIPGPWCSLRPPFVHLGTNSGVPALSRASDPSVHRHGGWRYPPPQGLSLRSRFCCPGPSSLTQPHPPHSRAHRDFTAMRLIRDAFAVQARLGDLRVVPGFS